MINFTEKLQNRFKNWVVSAKKHSDHKFNLDETGMLRIDEYYVCKLPSIWQLSLIQDWLKNDLKIAVDVYSELRTEFEIGFRFSADLMSVDDYEGITNGTIRVDEFFDTYEKALTNVINLAITIIDKNQL